MALEIVWSDEADKQLDEIIDYLKNTWNERQLHDFFTRLEESLKAIKTNPGTFKDSQRKAGVKEFLVTPHNTLFYTFDKKCVYIISFWANKKLLKN